MLERLFMIRYAIIGHPIAHSLSPLMHNTAFTALGVDARYEALDVPPDNLRETVRNLFEQNYGGFNVTVPHKESIVPLLDALDVDARIIGAVNTVVRDHGRFIGYNTDTIGFMRSLEPFYQRVRNKPVAVLGAGGAARAVIHTLLSNKITHHIIVINRTFHRAERLAKHFASERKTIEVRPITKTAETILQSSLVINTTSLGMAPGVNASPVDSSGHFHNDQVVMDLIYTPIETKFLRLAKTGGATVLSGLEMFLRQGARAFELWTGKQMPLEEVRKVVEEKLREQ